MIAKRLSPQVLGGLFALVAAVALFTRFSLDGNLWRDESIYAYAGQQFAKGVPIYASIFDPKPPLASILTGLGALVGGWFGVNDVHAMRLEFFAFACLAVVAVYALVLRLWNSPLAAIASAATFVSFKGFARDALEGPDSKTPGVLFAVLSMTLLVRRHWFWAAFTGSLAFLVWQPLLVYPAVAIVWAVVSSDAAERWRCGARALAGAVLPVAVTLLYLAIAGALPKFIEASITFPFTGVRRVDSSLGTRLHRIVDVVNASYGNGRILFWGGLVLLLGLFLVLVARARPRLARVFKDPCAVVVVGTFLGVAAFTLSDFQGYPDLYPLLPYAAIGIGGAVALVEQRVSGTRWRRAVTALSLAGVAIVVALSWSEYSTHPGRGWRLPAEQKDARTLNSVLGPGGTLYALGDPTPLVLTKRRNPNRYIYLDSGVDRWVIRNSPGRLKTLIMSSDPEVVIVGEWHSPAAGRVVAWLTSKYGSGTYLGQWFVFAKPAVRARAHRIGLKL